MCGHTSIIALFRFELQNYFPIPVELRITYLLPIGRTNESARKSHIDNRPMAILPTLTALVRGQSWLMQASVSTVGQASFLQTIGFIGYKSMCVDIGTQYPHKHHATFTLFPKAKILDSIKQIAIHC